MNDSKLKSEQEKNDLSLSVEELNEKGKHIIFTDGVNEFGMD